MSDQLLFERVSIKDFIDNYNIDPEFLDLIQDFMIMSKFFVSGGMWIAGGCFGRFIRGEKLADFHSEQEIISNMGKYDSYTGFECGSYKDKQTANDYQKGDIDIFFSSAADRNNFIKYIDKYSDLFSNTKIIGLETGLARTIIINVRGYRIKTQLVHCEFFKTPEDVLSNFDLSCCMVATDGFDVIYNKFAISDSKEKILHYNKHKLKRDVEEKFGNPFRAMRRYEKYIKNGFSIDNTQLNVYINYIQSLDFSNSNVNTEEYNWLPKKGKIDHINDLVKIQSSPGNYDVNEYMRGFANGLILAKAVLENEEPKYFESIL
jgi:hypothetical protein